jgi:hypothetical protein
MPTVVASFVPNTDNYAVTGMANVSPRRSTTVSCWDANSYSPFSGTIHGFTAVASKITDLATNGIVSGSPVHKAIVEWCEDVGPISASGGLVFGAQLTGVELTSASTAAANHPLGLRPRNRITWGAAEGAPPREAGRTAVRGSPRRSWGARSG